MARDGLSERECAEILGELRRQCCSVNDELLVWLASTFALKAPVNFDPNDLALLLNQPERKVIRQKTFSQDITPTDALEALLSEVGAEDGCSGGLLILRSTAKRINEYWTCSIGAVMGRFHESIGPNADAVYSVLVDEQLDVSFELFVLIAVSSSPSFE